MTKSPIDYSIIIPVYNEQQRLPAAIDQILTYLGSLDHTHEVIFVDDGSSDQTAAIISQHQGNPAITYIAQDKNYGKGWAVRTGMLAATGAYRAFIDADMATPIQELDKLFASLQQGHDVAIGSRITADGIDLRLVGKKPQPFSRRLLGKIFRLVATRPFLGNIRDSQCGAKAFTAQAAQDLFSQQTIQRWSFDIEILFLAKKRHYKVAQVPVDWSAQDNSKLQPSLDLAISITRELLSIAWHHRGTLPALPKAPTSA